MAEPQTIQQQLEAEKSAIDAMTDTTEAALAGSCLKLKMASFKGEPGAASNLVKAQKALDEYRAARDSVSTPTELRFKKLDSSKEPCVLSYLQSLGWMLQKTKLAKDAQEGKLLKRGGWYYAKDAEVYARTWCKAGVTAPPDQSDIDKSHEQARIARETADKLAFNNEVLRGNYLPRNIVEQGLAERAAFLKQDLSNFGPYMADLFVEIMATHLKNSGVDIDSANVGAIVPDLLEQYDTRLEKWLGRYASGNLVQP